MTPRAYVASLLAFALLAWRLIALVGLTVDGFGLFGTRLIGASHFPPDLRLSVSGDRVTKAIEIAEREGDRVLFVGNSARNTGSTPTRRRSQASRRITRRSPGRACASRSWHSIMPSPMSRHQAHRLGIILRGIPLRHRRPRAIARIRPSPTAASPLAFCAISSPSTGWRRASRRCSKRLAMCAPP